MWLSSQWSTLAVVVFVLVGLVQGQRQQWTSRGSRQARGQYSSSSLRGQSDQSILAALKQRYDNQRYDNQRFDAQGSQVRDLVDLGGRGSSRLRNVERTFNDLGGGSTIYRRRSLSGRGLGSGLRDNTLYRGTGDLGRGLDRYGNYEVLAGGNVPSAANQRILNSGQGQRFLNDRSRSFGVGSLSGNNFDVYQSGSGLNSLGAGNSILSIGGSQNLVGQGNVISSQQQLQQPLTSGQIIQQIQQPLTSGQTIQQIQQPLTSVQSIQQLQQPLTNSFSGIGQAPNTLSATLLTSGQSIQRPQQIVQTGQNTVVSLGQQAANTIIPSTITSSNLQFQPATSGLTTTYVQGSANVVPVVQQTAANIVPVSTVLQPASFVLQQPAMVSLATQPVQTFYSNVQQGNSGFGGVAGMGGGLSGQTVANGGLFSGMPPVIVKIEDMFPSYQHPTGGQEGSSGSMGGPEYGGHNGDPNLSVIKLDEGLRVILNHSDPYKKLVNLPTPRNEEEASLLRKILEKAEAPEYIRDMINILPPEMGMSQGPMVGGVDGVAAAAVGGAGAVGSVGGAVAAAGIGAVGMTSQIAAQPAATVAGIEQAVQVATAAGAAAVQAGAPIVQAGTPIVQTQTAVGASPITSATAVNGPLQEDMAIDEILVSAYSVPIPDKQALQVRFVYYPLASDPSNGQFILTALDMQLTRQQFSEMHASPGSLIGIVGRKKRKAISNTRARWPGAVIPYEISPDGFSAQDQQQIVSAMTQWAQSTCIQFRPAQLGDVNKLVFRQGRGCSSNVGMIGGAQYLTLQKECRIPKILLHEIGHAIGLIHEHQREDRDNYLKIRYENIKPGGIKDFNLFKVGSVDHSMATYDYMSIMHYGKTAFSQQPGLITMEAVDPKFTSIMGTAKILSYSDINTVNIMYGCGAGAGYYQSPLTSGVSQGQTVAVAATPIDPMTNTGGAVSSAQGVQVGLASPVQGVQQVSVG